MSAAGADQRELYGLLVQNIAEAVVEYARCSGEAGAVFDNGGLSTWEWACDLLCDAGISEPLVMDPLTNELTPSEEGDLGYFYRFRMNVNSVAHFLSSQPRPAKPSFDQVLSHWLAIHDDSIPTTREPFSFPQTSKFMKAIEDTLKGWKTGDPKALQILEKALPATTDQRGITAEVWAEFADFFLVQQRNQPMSDKDIQIEQLLIRLASAGYLRKQGELYVWTEKVAGAMTILPCVAWRDDQTD